MKKKEVDLHTSIKLLNIAVVLVLKGAGGGDSSTSIWSTCKLVDRAKRGKLVDRANLLYKWPTGRQGQLVDQQGLLLLDRQSLPYLTWSVGLLLFLSSFLAVIPSSLSISVRLLFAWLWQRLISFEWNFNLSKAFLTFLGLLLTLVVTTFNKF